MLQIAPILGQNRVQAGAEPCRSSAIGRRCSKHDGFGGSGRAPTSLRGDLGRQSYLSIQRTEHPLQIGYDRLVLDGEQPAGWRMPRQQIDAPPLSANGESDLNRAPPSQAGQDPDQRLAHRSMRRVKEPIQFFASPANSDIQLAAEGDNHPFHVAERSARDHSPFRPRHGRLRQPGMECEIGLAPPEPVPQRPHRPAEPLLIH